MLPQPPENTGICEETAPDPGRESDRDDVPVVVPLVDARLPLKSYHRRVTDFYVWARDYPDMKEWKGRRILINDPRLAPAFYKIVSLKSIFAFSGRRWHVGVEHEFDVMGYKDPEVSPTPSMSPSASASPSASSSGGYYFVGKCRFNLRDSGCRYSGPKIWCDRTIETCKSLGNAKNFGGFPIIFGKNP